jgi:hypothetical protein
MEKCLERFRSRKVGIPELLEKTEKTPPLSGPPSGIRGRGPLSGAATTDCQQGRGRGGRSAPQPAAAPPPRRKTRVSQRGSSGKCEGAANASRGDPGRAAGTIVCTGPISFHCTNHRQDPSTMAGAPAMGLHGPMLISKRDSFFLYNWTGKIF